MASWNVPTIHATGDILSVTDWNNVANNTTFLYQAPYFIGQTTAGTALGNSTNTVIPLSIVNSGYGMAYNTFYGYLTPPLVGTYFMSAGLTVAANAAGSPNNFRAEIWQNSGVYATGSTGAFQNSGTSAVASQVSTLVYNASTSNNYQLQAFNRASNSASLTTTGVQNYMTAHFVGSA